MGQIVFTHQNVGTLVIDNGIDDIRWGYNLNLQSFPTFGGEVVQVLSVYIDDLMMMGTVATYKQAEAIYSYFSSYIQLATQGKNAQPNVGKSAYNLYPVYFRYSERDWTFKIYPKTAPGFRYGRDVVTPTWQLSAHVIDDSPDLNLIKDGIKALATKKLIDGQTASKGFALNGEISPGSGNPDTDPFQTFIQSADVASKAITTNAEYFNSLIPAYGQGDFSSLTGFPGSKPSPAAVTANAPSAQTTPGKNPTSSTNKAGGIAPPSSGQSFSTPNNVPHNAKYKNHFNTVFNNIWIAWRNGGCAAILGIINQYIGGGNSQQTDSVLWQAEFDAAAVFILPPYNCGRVH